MRELADCKHTPKCPNRRACKKYAGMADREVARLLMSLDFVMGAMRDYRRALEIIGCVRIDELSPVDKHERLETIASFRRLVEDIAQAVADSPPSDILPKLPSWVH